MAENKAQKGRILVVDDEEPVARIIVKLLQQDGYEVEWASGFAQVQEKTAKSAFDLMTLDVMMPGTNGLDVLQWARKHHPDTGVIMATAMGDLDTVLQAMRLGAYSYILKPFNLDLVLTDVDRAMERQQLVAENRAYQRDLEKKVEEQTRELRRAYAELEKKVRELEARDRLVQVQMSPPEEETQAYEEILQAIARVAEVGVVCLYRPDNSAKKLELVAGLGLSAAGRLESGERLRKEGGVDVGGEEPVARAFRERQPCADGQGVAAVPIVYQKEALGAIQVSALPAQDEAREAALNAVWRLAREVALVLRMVQMAEDLERGDLEVSDLLKLEE